MSQGTTMEDDMSPTSKNPVPILPAAFREDNRAQLLSILRANPISDNSIAISSVYAKSDDHSPVSFRQLLIFEDESLRTLLLQHVLPDPKAAGPAVKGVSAKKVLLKDEAGNPIPNGLGIVGTRLLSALIKQTAKPTTKNPFDHDQLEDTDDTLDRLLESVHVITYFVRSSLSQTQLVAKYIRSSIPSLSGSSASGKLKNTNARHRMVYVPQSTAACRKLLHDQGLMSGDRISIHNVHLDLIPLDNDVLSMEYDLAIRDADVEGTPSLVVSGVARSLLKVQDVVGKIKRIQSMGPLGEEVVRKLMSLTLDEYTGEQNDSDAAAGPAISAAPVEEGDVAALVIMDRKVDLVTPLLTPLTYEGLLDDCIGIENGFIKVDASLVNPDDENKEDQPSEVAIALNGSDTLYAEVRDMHVEKFGSFLQDQARALKESHANFTNKEKKKDLTEIHQFVKNIPIFSRNVKSLTNHIHLAELVKANTEESTFRERWQTERSILEGEVVNELLEDMIASDYHPLRLLRLLCLQSLAAGGIKSSKFDSFRRDIIQSYGYEYLCILSNLEKVGLIRRRETIWMDKASPFATLRKSLVLINAEVNTVDPNDASYVSSGYAPISTRLVQTAVGGWNGKEEALRELPGRLVDVTQQQPPEDLPTALKSSPKGAPLSQLSAATNTHTSDKKPTLLVFFVGGVTCMEIATMRFLSKRPSFPFRIVCCTTNVINGNSFVKSIS